MLRKITEWLGWFVFTKDAYWWRALAIGIIFIVLIVIYYLTSYLGKIKEAQIEKFEEEKEKIERRALGDYVKKFGNIFRRKQS